MTIRAVIIYLAITEGLLPAKVFGQIMETEDASPLHPAQFHIETSVALQLDKDQKEITWPFGFEYGISKRLMVLAEPVVLTSINPDSGATSTGIGDLEVNVFFQLLSEKKVLPSLCLAGEVKIPTAQNEDIGTGKFDYSCFLIANKTTGKFFTTMNLGYTFLGKHVNGLSLGFFECGVSSTFEVSPKGIFFGEVYGNTSAVDIDDLPVESLPIKTILENSEFAGGEIVFGAGYAYHLQNGLLLSFSANYSNSNELLLRAGIEWESGKNKLKTAFKNLKKKIKEK